MRGRRLLDRRRGLVISEDLVDTEGDVGKEEAAFDDVAAAAADTPSGEKDGACNGNADQERVLAVEPWEGGDAVEEVDATGQDAAAED